MRTRKSVARDGVPTTARRGARFVAGLVLAIDPRRRSSRRERGVAERQFDVDRGVETGAPREVLESEVTGPHWLDGHGYQGIPPSFSFTGVLADLSLQYEEFTFVDLGAGKGRALLVAAEAPFRSIVGVEYSAALAEVARANVDRARDDRIAVVHADAASYPLPDGPLVLFLFNPFEAPVMRTVVRSVSEAYAAYARRIVVVYLVPRCRSLWDEVPFLGFVGMRSGAAIYDTGPVLDGRPVRAGEADLQRSERA